MSTAFTFYFEELIPDYNTWKGIIQQANIVNYDDVLESNFDVFCYNLLSRHFSHQNIRYYEPEAFILELVNVYENKFKQFKKEKELIDAMQDLTLQELQLIQTSIVNMANNPNDQVEDPTQPLNYISAQTYTNLQSNRLKAYLDALNNIPSLNVYKFFNANKPNEMGFIDLFMNVQPINFNLYDKGR